MTTTKMPPGIGVARAARAGAPQKPLAQALAPGQFRQARLAPLAPPLAQRRPPRVRRCAPPPARASPRPAAAATAEVASLRSASRSGAEPAHSRRRRMSRPWAKDEQGKDGEAEKRDQACESADFLNQLQVAARGYSVVADRAASPPALGSAPTTRSARLASSPASTRCSSEFSVDSTHSGSSGVARTARWMRLAAVGCSSSPRPNSSSWSFSPGRGWVNSIAMSVSGS